MELNLIRKIAWSFHRTTGAEFEDLFQEGCLAWLEAAPKYDPAMGVKKTTFLSNAIQNQLCDQFRNARSNGVELDWEQEDNSFQESINFKDKMTFSQGWGKEARMIAQFIFESPLEFLEANSPRKAVRESLRENGWSWGKIWKGFRDIKINLNKM